MTLRDRCREILSTMRMDGILRQNDPVETLVAFVTAETGRSADVSLKESLPCVLYFQTAADRDEFIELLRIAKPGMVSRKLP